MTFRTRYIKVHDMTSSQFMGMVAMGDYPLVNTQKAIENGDLVRGFPH
jgi:hypothetical protein